MKPKERIKLLLTDDDEDVRALIKSILISGGYDVTEASNGQETLRER